MDSKNQKIKRPKRQQKVIEDYWDCSVCTFRNTAEAFKCSMCDVRKGEICGVKISKFKWFYECRCEWCENIEDVKWKYRNSVARFALESPEKEVWRNFFPQNIFFELLTAADSQYTLD